MQKWEKGVDNGGDFVKKKFKIAKDVPIPNI